MKQKHKVDIRLSLDDIEYENFQKAMQRYAEIYKTYRVTYKTFILKFVDVLNEYQPQTTNQE